jgi:hypothetical protein
MTMSLRSSLPSMVIDRFVFSEPCYGTREKKYLVELGTKRFPASMPTRKKKKEKERRKEWTVQRCGGGVERKGRPEVEAKGKRPAAEETHCRTAGGGG